MTSGVIEPAIFQLVAQCLDKLRPTTCPFSVNKVNKESVNKTYCGGYQLLHVSTVVIAIIVLCNCMRTLCFVPCSTMVAVSTAEMCSHCYCVQNMLCPYITSVPGSSVGIATELRAGRSGDRIPVGARFSPPVNTGPGAHPASCTMGTGSFPGVKSGRGVTLTPHSLLVPLVMKE